MTVNDSEELSLKPYVIRFSIFYALFSIGLAVLAGLFDSFFEVNIPSSGVALGALFGSAYAVVYAFVEKNNRVFTADEKTRLAWMSFGAMWLVSITLFIIMSIGFYIFFGVSLWSVLVGKHELSSGLFFFVMLITIVVSFAQYFLLRWIYGKTPQQILDAQKKKQQKSTNN